MRFANTLNDLLATKARTRILRQLALSPLKQFTGREIARAARVSPTQGLEALETFRRAGLVDRSTFGATTLWRLSGDHVLSNEIRRIFEFERGLLDRLFEDVRGALRGIPVRSAWVFGSVAEGRERPDSDVDLFVEVPSLRAKRAAQERLLDLWARGASRYGNPVNSLVYTTRERADPPNPALVRSILEKGIRVIGGGAE